MLAWVSGASAQLQFTQTAIDVGKVYSGKPLTREFAFRNVGAVPVEIVEAKGSCGCTRPKVTQRLIPPGGTGTLPVELNTLGQAEGRNSWSVTVRTKYGDQAADVALRIDADLVQEIRIEPAALQLFVRDSLTAELLLHDQRPMPLRVQSVQATAPALRVQVKAEPPARHRLAVEVADGFPEGRHEEVLSIVTDDPDYRELTMPVTIVKTAKKRVSATPASVVLSGRPVGAKVVLLRDADDKPVAVKDVTANHPALRFSFAAGPGSMTTLRVRCEAKDVPVGGIQGEVKVEVSAPVPQVVVIPVRVE